jgi:hypothetical protein
MAIISHFKPKNSCRFAQVDNAAQSTLATYWMKDAPKRYRDLRGKLIETELQATRLRNQTAEAPDLRDGTAIPTGQASV